MPISFNESPLSKTLLNTTHTIKDDSGHLELLSLTSCVLKSF